MGLLVYGWLSPVVRNRSLAWADPTDFILSRHPGVASPSAQLSPWGDTEQLWTHLGTSLIIHYTTADISSLLLYWTTSDVLGYACLLSLSSYDLLVFHHTTADITSLLLYWTTPTVLRYVCLLSLSSYDLLIIHYNMKLTSGLYLSTELRLLL